MKKVVKTTLEYSKDEIKNILISAISNAHQMVIESFTMDGTTVKVVGQAPQDGRIPEHTKVDVPMDHIFGIAPPVKARITGLTKFLRNLFEGGHQWPQDKILDECKKAGFDITVSRLRGALAYPGLELVERDKEVWQSKEHYKNG